jgi:hypothetical protein
VSVVVGVGLLDLPLNLFEAVAVDWRLSCRQSALKMLLVVLEAVDIGCSWSFCRSPSVGR